MATDLGDVMFAHCHNAKQIDIHVVILQPAQDPEKIIEVIEENMGAAVFTQVCVLCFFQANSCQPSPIYQNMLSRMLDRLAGAGTSQAVKNPRQHILIYWPGWCR